jgi:hypothetical protein
VSLDGQVDMTGYLTPYSDVVSLMVLDHQVHLVNLFTRATWESRVGVAARVAEAAEAIVEYMLYVDEAPIVDGPIVGSSGFAEQFTAAGLRDANGRSLRDLDLKTRLQKYPLSYMIDSPSFQALPPPVKDLVMGKITRVLAGEETGLGLFQFHAWLGAAIAVFTGLAMQPVGVDHLAPLGLSLGAGGPKWRTTDAKAQPCCQPPHLGDLASASGLPSLHRQQDSGLFCLGYQCGVIVPLRCLESARRACGQVSFGNALADQQGAFLLPITDQLLVAWGHHLPVANDCWVGD